MAEVCACVCLFAWQIKMYNYPTTILLMLINRMGYVELPQPQWGKEDLNMVFLLEQLRELDLEANIGI